MESLRGTIDMPLTMEADDLSVVKWWVDASYGVHPDMKSHTGAKMSMGKGSIYSRSTRQKLNTKSSTEAELVGVDGVMPQVLWTWKPRDTKSMTPRYTRTIKALFCLQRMGGGRAVSEQDTSTYDFFLH
jgi:hypothetical protein